MSDVFRCPAAGCTYASPLASQTRAHFRLEHARRGRTPPSSPPRDVGVCPRCHLASRYPLRFIATSDGDSGMLCNACHAQVEYDDGGSIYDVQESGEHVAVNRPPPGGFRHDDPYLAGGAAPLAPPRYRGPRWGQRSWRRAREEPRERDGLDEALAEAPAPPRRRVRFTGGLAARVRDRMGGSGRYGRQRRPGRVAKRRC